VFGLREMVSGRGSGSKRGKRIHSSEVGPRVRVAPQMDHPIFRMLGPGVGRRDRRDALDRIHTSVEARGMPAVTADQIEEEIGTARAPRRQATGQCGCRLDADTEMAGVDTGIASMGTAISL